MVYVTVDAKNQALNEQHQHHSNNIHGQLLHHHHYIQQQSAIHPNQFPPRENSPYNNSSSEKESTSSSINLGGNTFRNSHGMCVHLATHCFRCFCFPCVWIIDFVSLFPIAQKNPIRKINSKIMYSCAFVFVSISTV